MNGYTLDEGEQIIKVIRRHWIALVPIWVSSGALLLVVIAAAYAEGRYRDLITPYVPLSYVNLFAVALGVLAVLGLVIGYWVYDQNQMIITNMHIIQIHQNGLFNRRVSQLSLGRIEDVSGSSEGVLATMLGFGKIEVQTAGEEEKFDFDLATDPQPLGDYIMQCHEDFVRQYPNREH
jgi:uncharacterized membrane protein YdbT with pleckstrin-like domain